MSSPLVLHVLPRDLARGAQRYARALRLELDGRDAQHRTLCLFESEPTALFADFSLQIRKGPFARFGLEPRALLALRSFLQAHRPQVIVAHGSEPLKYLAALRPRVPLVYYKIGVAHRVAHGLSRRLAHAALLQRADMVAGVSQECLDEARERFFVPEKRLRLIPNGRDPEVFRPRQEPARRPTLVFVGHFSPSKRPDLFIDIARRLRENGEDFRACMIGSGPLLSSLSAPAAAAGVELLGQRSDVPELLRQSDVFLFTSIAEGEGMPGVFIEAGLSGLPIVSTDVPGARTCVQQGRSGYVVGVDDHAGLTEKVGELLRNPARRAEFGHAARAHCERNFSIEASTRHWQTLVTQLLAT